MLPGVASDIVSSKRGQHAVQQKRPATLVRQSMVLIDWRPQCQLQPPAATTTKFSHAACRIPPNSKVPFNINRRLEVLMSATGAASPSGTRQQPPQCQVVPAPTSLPHTAAGGGRQPGAEQRRPWSLPKRAERLRQRLPQPGAGAPAGRQPACSGSTDLKMRCVCAAGRDPAEHSSARRCAPRRTAMWGHGHRRILQAHPCQPNRAILKHTSSVPSLSWGG